jgi:hypothetical protein
VSEVIVLLLFTLKLHFLLCSFPFFFVTFVIWLRKERPGYYDHHHSHKPVSAENARPAYQQTYLQFRTCIKSHKSSTNNIILPPPSPTHPFSQNLFTTNTRRQTLTLPPLTLYTNSLPFTHRSGIRISFRNSFGRRIPQGYNRSLIIAVIFEFILCENGSTTSIGVVEDFFPLRSRLGFEGFGEEVS